VAGLEGHMGDDDTDRGAGPHSLDSGQEATRSADGVFGADGVDAGFRHDKQCAGRNESR
jgi:hypothetical protein